MYNVSITRLRVRSIFYLPVFMLHAMRTMLQALNRKYIMETASSPSPLSKLPAKT